jgi:hypothetical protein
MLNNIIPLMYVKKNVFKECFKVTSFMKINFISNDVQRYWYQK